MDIFSWDYRWSILCSLLLREHNQAIAVIKPLHVQRPEIPDENIAKRIMAKIIWGEEWEFWINKMDL